jgi:hypothetical protein
VPPCCWLTPCAGRKGGGRRPADQLVDFLRERDPVRSGQQVQSVPGRAVDFWTADLGYVRRERDWDPDFMMLIDPAGARLSSRCTARRRTSHRIRQPES